MIKPVYAVGDVHGQIDMLLAALELIRLDGGAEAQVIFLGDYVDRGPDSRAVIQTLMDGQASGQNWITLKGNHDRYFTRFLNDQSLWDPRTRAGLLWTDPILGGDKTLASYGVAAEAGMPVDRIHSGAVQLVPEAHSRFLETLPLTHLTDEILFVHAGIMPGVPLAEQHEDDLVWIRGAFLDDTRDHGRLIVHGHTALHAPQHYGNRINLDGGAGYGRPLTSVVFEGRTCWQLTPRGRVPLTV